MYHFALPSDEENLAASAVKSSGRTAKNRRGTNIVGEMLDKTAQLNAEQQVSVISMNDLF